MMAAAGSRGDSALRVLRSPVKYALIGFLTLYRLLISPLYGNVCRYWPSCSAYALSAVRMHGSASGSWLAVRRLARCHPWARGGYDPVPGTEDRGDSSEDSAEADSHDRAAGHGRVQPGHEGSNRFDRWQEVERMPTRGELVPHGATACGRTVTHGQGGS